ncbi:MAG: Heparinase N-terminus [Cyanobacteria bacterium RYN_339]|nr:Heparinase N-terminus [Cyanobacteria bacterium RYN_339]
MISQARWYWDRLRAMSPAELSGRGALAWRKRGWRRRTTWQAPAPTFWPAPAWTLPEGLQAESALLAEAEAYLRGEYRLLNLGYQETTPDWHLDPQTGRRAPLAFGPDLNYRDPLVAGNVKNTWEKNRHHHLTVLALAFALTRDERYAAEVDRQLRDWLQANPFPRGVNWTSMLELGVRLIAWVWIDRLLAGSAVHAGLFGTGGALWDAIYWHQWLMARCPSHGSSANNHLLGEVAGAYMAATAWPFFPESIAWRAHARQVLEREAALQTFESGLNREQAAAYHLFSLELFLLPAVEGDRAGEPFSPEYRAWLGRMLTALPRICDAAGHLPRFGDEDGGLGVQLRAQTDCRLTWLYDLGRRFLGLALPAGTSLAPLVWDQAATPLAYQAPQGSEAFADAGVYVLASDRGGPREVLCLADAGPLGFLSIAGHGHADALSFALNVGGQPVIVDPGTYVYHAEPAWRSYFRSTRAHNTVSVDGEEQSVARGPFLWGRRQAKAAVACWEPSSAGGKLVAHHDGYTRLPGRVMHGRAFELVDGRLAIEDTLEGTGQHQIEWRLHFSPTCDVRIEQQPPAPSPLAGEVPARAEGAQWPTEIPPPPTGTSPAGGEEGYAVCVVTWPGGQLEIACDPRLTWRLVRGEEDGGWYSGGFNLKEPTYTLVGAANLTLPTKLEHRLDVGFQQASSQRQDLAANQLETRVISS